jgi:hypothetical protein
MRSPNSTPDEPREIAPIYNLQKLTCENLLSGDEFGAAAGTTACQTVINHYTDRFD